MDVNEVMGSICRECGLPVSLKNCYSHEGESWHLSWVDCVKGLRAELEQCTKRRRELDDEAYEYAEQLEQSVELLTRVLMWKPKSTEDACEQDYEAARAFLAAQERWEDG